MRTQQIVTAILTSLRRGPVSGVPYGELLLNARRIVEENGMDIRGDEFQRVLNCMKSCGDVGHTASLAYFLKG